MEVMVVSAKCTVVTAQLGRACLAHQSGDLYPASFGIKRISSSISGITSLGKSGRTFGRWGFGKDQRTSSLERNEEQSWTLWLCKSDVGVWCFVCSCGGENLVDGILQVDTHVQKQRGLLAFCLCRIVDKMSTLCFQKCLGIEDVYHSLKKCHFWLIQAALDGKLSLLWGLS